MCSILGILEIEDEGEKKESLRRKIVELSGRQRHRGPDGSGFYKGKSAILAHERLSIIDVETGEQPLSNEEGTLSLIVNGEIYNYRELRERYEGRYSFRTRSDSEIILALYQEKGTDFLNDLRGMFAFILYDAVQDSYLIARDPIGIIPLYTGYDEEGNLYVSSEAKGILSECRELKIFPPGHLMTSGMKEPRAYYHRPWKDYEAVKEAESSVEQLREALEKSVHSHLMSDVPYGVLLSGGLDSSIVAAVAKKFSARRVDEEDQTEAWWPRLHSFAVGLKESPDLKIAAEASRHIETVHHEFHFTVEQGLDALSDVIRHLETYDVTTIRASVPMYLMARKIRAMGIKMVLSGEGADEIFGGYLYFHAAPGPREFHEETVRKLERLHYYDCLRANKSMMAWGVETRVPFLDRNFLDTAMSLNPKDKMISGDRKIEKRILREAFQDYLPDSVLWRQKEQFSDGVGYSWIDGLKDFAEKEISDKLTAKAPFRFPYNTPETKEAYLYRSIFEKYFPSEAVLHTVPGGKSAACSTDEAFRWLAEKGMNDPSGRAMKNIHEQGYL